ncbi:MAG: PEGA domain-containing protein [Candidatus Rokubacteria bacterium]|nr:PEGA domain-containing protein [Candidatus Rokubacteria bacterium]
MIAVRLLVAALVVALGLAPAPAAGGGLRVNVNADLNVNLGGPIFSADRGDPKPRHEPAFLIVDAMPVAAEVFLDGRRLGSAHELVARALPLSRGRHAIRIVSPGFKPYTTAFTADASFPTRIRVVLAPE